MGGENSTENRETGKQAPERIISSTTVNGRVIYIQYVPSVLRKTITAGIMSFSALLLFLSAAAMLTTPVPFILTGLVFTSAAIVAMITFPFWSWTFFGREFVEINENRVIVIRSSWLKKTKPHTVELDEHTTLMLNMQDSWSWRTFREKGVFRVSNESQSIDFGIKLNEQDFEKLHIILNRAMRMYKELALQHKLEPTAVHTEYGPPLDKQQGGRAVESLHEYFKQYSPSEKTSAVKAGNQQ